MFLLALFTTACAGTQRWCSSTYAENFGSDWIIVQYGFDGKPINCWQLRGAAVTNETASDGVYWKDSVTGHLIHISGWYNRVQVSGSDFPHAAALLGVSLDRCTNGHYNSVAEK
jgi:hypothetical protein